MDDTVLLRRLKKIIQGSRGREGSGRKREWGGKRGREREESLYSLRGDGSDGSVVKPKCEDSGSEAPTELLNWECAFDFSTQEVKAGDAPDQTGQLD